MSEVDRAPEIEIDVEALTRKYAEERAKRLRDDAWGQYQELKGKFADFARDPYADPSFTREPVTEEVDVLIIGGGFGGLLAGGRLREALVDKIRIIEKAGDFGGTWYWNRYPGAACDVESYIYLPMLEEMGYIPSEKYAGAQEIQAHCRMLAERYDLYRAALFQTEANSARWNEERDRWIVSTDRGDEIAARFVISSTGFLSKPKLPGIPGIESFEGHSFHTSRWDYRYTGGGPDTPMAGLSDKKVGIIGTGSTGIQCIPHLAESSGHLYVFQRTPSSVDVRGNRPTDLEWASTLEPGWQRKRMDNFTSLTSGGHQPVDMVQDGWTDIMRSISLPAGTDATSVDPAQLQLAEMKKMEQTRRRVDAIVEDKATAEALKPYYHYFCKRPCFHDEYLAAFNRDNVTLVDTKGKGVERITPKGAVVAGKEYELDCLIFATGFDFLTDYTSESGVEFYGRGGEPLARFWQDGARTLHGIQTHGFPNLFLVRFNQAGTTVNYVHIADEQAKHIAHIIVRCRNEGIVAVEATRDAVDGWVEEVMTTADSARAFFESCTPGYYNYEGKRVRSAGLNALYAGGPISYIKLLEEWRSEGTMQGLRIHGEAH